MGAVQAGQVDALLEHGIEPDLLIGASAGAVNAAAIAKACCLASRPFLNRGALIPALPASCVLPGVFPPVVDGDRVLVNGALVADAPIGRAVALGATRVSVLPTQGANVAQVPTGAAHLPLRAQAPPSGPPAARRWRRGPTTATSTWSPPRRRRCPRSPPGAAWR